MFDCASELDEMTLPHTAQRTQCIYMSSCDVITYVASMVSPALACMPSPLTECCGSSDSPSTDPEASEGDVLEDQQACGWDQRLHTTKQA
jgi:hypothetical protein